MSPCNGEFTICDPMDGRDDLNVLLGFKFCRHHIGEYALLIRNNDSNSHGREPRSLFYWPESPSLVRAPTPDGGACASTVMISARCAKPSARPAGAHGPPEQRPADG